MGTATLWGNHTISLSCAERGRNAVAHQQGNNCQAAADQRSSIGSTGLRQNLGGVSRGSGSLTTCFWLAEVLVVLLEEVLVVLLEEEALEEEEPLLDLVLRTMTLAEPLPT